MKLIYSTFIILIVITISIIIIIITSIIAIIINSTKDDISDIEEIFHKLTNSREQSLMPSKQKKKKVLSLFTSSCISYWQARLGIVQCCSIVPSFVSSIGESWDSAFILPRNFPAVLIIFTGRAGNPPLPTAQGGAGNPAFPAGRVPCGAGRPSLVFTNALGYREWPRPLTKHTADIFGKGSMPWVLHFSRQSLIPWGPQLGSWPAHTDTGSWPLPLSDILGPPVQSRSSDISLARPRSW